MKKKLLILMLVLIDQMTVHAQQKMIPYERLSFDRGWRFHLGDIPFPEIKGHGMSYGNAKAGKAWGAAAPDYDDTGWRLLNLPHDWAVEQPFDSTANLSQGYRQRGIGWYRRNFRLSAADRGKHLELQFDGVATHCTVWVNGIVVHRNWSGYTSFYIDFTALAKYGDDLNNVVIRVDAIDQEGWWYEGAGIYRHTWLVKQAPVHLITDGVFAQPVKLENESWSIPVEATVENSGKENSVFEIESILLDQRGKKVSGGKTSGTVSVLAQTKVSFNFAVNAPELWTLDKPALYQVVTRVKSNGVLCDSLVTTCGFRTIKFTADSGFYLNGRHVKIKGVCGHQDHAGVGVAVPDALWDFRLKKLKEMGVNGYRCAHNPPAKEFLEACDRAGILVMDENRNFNSSPEYVRQLEWMVRRDRNHPGIILWSVFNEEPMQGTEIGYEMVRRMSAVVKTLDTTRPVTAAANGGLFSPVNVTKAVDVVGFNYQIGAYDRFHQENPTLPLTSSEDVSGLMTRGEYENNKIKHLLEAYDTQKPAWGATHRNAWKAIAERPFIAGCFVWTGFDYRGEPQPLEWPTASSSFGIMDLCGFPKTAFYIHQAQWIEDKPVLQLVPHWNWPATDIGKDIRVMILTNADRVKLSLNGKTVKEGPVDKYEMATWNVPYQPGKLEAVGYKNGKEVSHFTVETTGEPVRLQLIADKRAMAGNGWDAQPVTVQALDARGRPVPTANLPVEFEVTGPADIIGLGNGDANSHEPEKGNKRSLYNGLAQVILQSQVNGAGQVRLRARSGGLKDAMLVIDVKASPQIPFVAAVNPTLLLDKWRISPVTMTKPDPNQLIADFDMNSWAPVKPGYLQTMTNGSFVIYRTVFTPYAGQQRTGSELLIRKLTGKAEIYLDKKLVASKTDNISADIKIAVPGGIGEHILSILIEAGTGQKAGLGGIIALQDKSDQLTQAPEKPGK